MPYAKIYAASGLWSSDKYSVKNHGLVGLNNQQSADKNGHELPPKLFFVKMFWKPCWLSVAVAKLNSKHGWQTLRDMHGCP